MAKIGIITYHFAANYGAVLQCYALSKYLEECGHTVLVLNCVSKKQANNNSLYRECNSIKMIAKNLVLLPFHSKRKKRIEGYNNFRKKHLNLTKLVETSDELERLIDEHQFDYVISGSDQVFNPNIHDFESAFLFPFETKSKKIGYAVSVGKATVEQLMQYEKWIKDFEAISAREQSAAERLEKMIGKNQVVVDPVFLLNKNRWSDICTKKEKKYVLGYFINVKYYQKYIEIAKKIASEKGLELIIIDARITKYILANNIVNTAGPKEFIDYFMNAEYICTDSFHGTSFSIIFEKPFLCFEPKKNSLDTRKTNLCKIAGLEKQLYYLDSENVINKDYIDYVKVKANMSESISLSKEYLNNNLQ